LPPSVHSYEWTARQSRDQRRYPESAAQWRKAIGLAPREARLRTELAITLRLQRDLAGAQSALEEALKLDPAAPDANYFLGDVLLAQDQPARAIPFLEASLRVDAQAPHTHGALGRAYALSGRPADAIPHLEQSLESDVDGSLRLQLGRAYQATGQAERARAALADYEEFRKAAQPDAPEDPGAAITAPR
jgi:tetratricopeptide (TPR) repeat protein